MFDKEPTLLLAGTAATENAAERKWPDAKILGRFNDLTLVEFMMSSMVVDIVAVDAGLSTKGESFDAWQRRFRAAFPHVSLVIMNEAENQLLTGSKKSGIEKASHTKVVNPQTVVVWSPKGGVGKTFLATNLACAAAMSTQGEACLCDLDLYSGDVSVHLDLTGGPTLTDLVPGLRSLRPEALDKYVQRHSASKLNVLCGPKRPELSDLVTTEHVRLLLELARRRWGLVFLDTPPDITSDVVGECIDAASKVIIVVTQDIAALRQCKMAIDILQKLGIQHDTVCAVLNLAVKDSLLPEQKIQEFLGVDLVGVIPQDRKAVERSVYEGKPVVLNPRSEVSDAIWGVASSVLPGLAIEKRGGKKPPKRKVGFFR